MAIKLKWVAILILIYIATTNFRCHKICLESVSKYTFGIGIKAEPDKDTIHVGDTLWLVINVPVKLMDQKTNKMIDYSRAVNLGTAISFVELIDTNNTNDHVASEFVYDLIVGREIKRSDTNKYKEYNFKEINHKYQFKLGIIPKSKGVFKLFVSNAANVYRSNDKCTKAFFEIGFRDTDQHLYLNKVGFPSTALSPGGGVYLFKVD